MMGRQTGPARVAARVLVQKAALVCPARRFLGCVFKVSRPGGGGCPPSASACAFARPSVRGEGTHASCLYCGHREQDSRSTRGGTVLCRLDAALPRSVLGARLRGGHPPSACARLC